MEDEDGQNGEGAQARDVVSPEMGEMICGGHGVEAQVLLRSGMLPDFTGLFPDEFLEKGRTFRRGACGARPSARAGYD